jgi:hypothetical protein
MPYYIRSTKGGGEMLVEESAADVKRYMRTNLDTHYDKVDGRTAHAWVMSGNVHGTGLFTEFVDSKSYPYRRMVVRKAQGILINRLTLCASVLGQF